MYIQKCLVTTPCTKCMSMSCKQFDRSVFFPSQISPTWSVTLQLQTIPLILLSHYTFLSVCAFVPAFPLSACPFLSCTAVLEKPLEKKAGRNYGPPGSRRLIYFIDDMNMPEVDAYGTVQPHTLIRQHMDYNHWSGSVIYMQICNIQSMYEQTWVHAWAV